MQHHPARAHLIPTLLERLAPIPTEIIEHASDPPSPWRGYQLCLTDPPDCTHLLVIQDDSQPCSNFAAEAAKIAEENPDTPVCLFFPPYAREKKAFLDALRRGQRYITLSLSSQSFMPVVAVLWPRAKAIEFLQWAQNNAQLPGQRDPRSDDAMAGRWKLMARQEVRVTVPSLVDHLDEPSVCGNNRKGERRALAFSRENAESPEGLS